MNKFTYGKNQTKLPKEEVLKQVAPSAKQL